MMEIHFWNDDDKLHQEADVFLKIEISSPDISSEELEQLEREAIRQYHALNCSLSEDKHSLSDGGNHG